MLDEERRGLVAAPLVMADASCRLQGPSLASVAFEEKSYTITPAAVEVHAARIIAGEITDMRVVQRVERISGRVISPPRLMGTLRLWSSSMTHSVRLVVAKIQYLDDQWCPIKLDDSRTHGTFKFATDGIEWIDPGQEAIHAIDVAFPAEALKARRLTRLRLEIGYVSSPYREEMVSFAVSIGSQEA